MIFTNGMIPFFCHSKKANKKKSEMFNKGEIEVFRRVGLTPVFFGETMIGTKLPCLTYMLVFENMAAHDANWGKFDGDPEWKKLSSTPGYTRNSHQRHEFVLAANGTFPSLIYFIR